MPSPLTTTFVRAALVLCVTVVSSHAAEPAGSPAAREAFALCHGVEQLPSDERMPTLERSLVRAEAAVAADSDDPLAHFAVFCALGKSLQLRGVGFGTLRDLRRAKAELETALALAPYFPDALAAKGAMLTQLPRVLGGDTEQGVRLLDYALSLDPSNAETRLLLAAARGAQGTDAAQPTYTAEP